MKTSLQTFFSRPLTAPFKNGAFMTGFNFGFICIRHFFMHIYRPEVNCGFKIRVGNDAIGGNSGFSHSYARDL